MECKQMINQPNLKLGVPGSLTLQQAKSRITAMKPVYGYVSSCQEMKFRVMKIKILNKENVYGQDSSTGLWHNVSMLTYY